MKTLIVITLASLTIGFSGPFASAGCGHAGFSGYYPSTSFYNSPYNHIQIQAPTFIPSQPTFPAQSVPTNPLPNPTAPAVVTPVSPVSVAAAFSAGYYTVNGLGTVYLQPSTTPGVTICTQIAPTADGTVYTAGYYNISGLGLAYIQPTAAALAQQRTAPVAPSIAQPTPSQTFNAFNSPSFGSTNSFSSSPSFSPPATQFASTNNGFGGFGGSPAFGGNQQSVPVQSFAPRPTQGGNQQAPAAVNAGNQQAPGGRADGGNQQRSFQFQAPPQQRGRR